MSALAFRNIDAKPSDPVRTWPYEGIVTAVERGMLSDWRRMVAEVKRAPWGRVARAIEQYAQYGEEEAVAALLTTAVRRARDTWTRREKEEVARRVRQAIAVSGMTARAFAAECGTSATRLSTYATGKVSPSAAMLVRMESVARRRPTDREGRSGDESA